MLWETEDAFHTDLGKIQKDFMKDVAFDWGLKRKVYEKECW